MILSCLYTNHSFLPNTRRRAPARRRFVFAICIFALYFLRAAANCAASYTYILLQYSTICPITQKITGGFFVKEWYTGNSARPTAFLAPIGRLGRSYLFFDFLHFAHFAF
jgi:hypothetical protein